MCIHVEGCTGHGKESISLGGLHYYLVHAGATVAISAATFWFSSFVVNQLTPLIVGSSLQLHGYFYIIVGLYMSAFLVIFFLLPETKVKLWGGGGGEGEGWGRGGGEGGEGGEGGGRRGREGRGREEGGREGGKGGGRERGKEGGRGKREGEGEEEGGREREREKREGVVRDKMYMLAYNYLLPHSLLAMVFLYY